MLDWLYYLFQNNLELVFFIYGLAFVIMGIVVFVQPKKESKFKLAGVMWLLAGFGLTHGANEWLDMWAIIRSSNPTLDLVRWFLLFISYLFLFEFGRRLVGLTWKAPSRKLVWWFPFVGLFILIAGFDSPNFWVTGGIWARYLLGFPGGLLICLGFLYYYRAEKERLDPIGVKKYFYVAALMFLVYGIFGGLIVPKGGFFPSNLLNTESFVLAVDIPVQVFRAGCAIGIAVAIGGMLRIFHWETTRQIQEAHVKLLESEERYRALVSSSPDSICELDLEGNVLYCNPGILRLYGMRNDEVIGLHYTDLVKTASINLLKDMVEKAKEGEPVKFEYESDTPSGAKWFECIIAPIKDGSGKVRRLSQTSRDVTERKKAEQALRESQIGLNRLNEFRKRVLESINDAILVLDVKDFTIVAANKALLEQVKMSEEEVIGKPCYLVTHDRSEPCCPPNDICPIQEMIKTGKTVVVEHIHYDKEGNPFHVEVSANLIKNEKGNIVQVVHVSRDVSERYKVMEMKDRFMSVATHELRTPLISIKGYVDYVLTGKLGTVAENVASSLEVVKRNTDRLLKLTDDLLDIQRITSEKLHLDLKPMDLREVIDHCVREAQPFLEEKKLRFGLEVPEGSLPVSGDDVRLSQVVMNLLINASKFTPEGGSITLHVEMDEKNIKVEVSDSGIGIRKEDLERVFQAFADVKKPTYIKGTGLGLSVTKGLVEAHGGSIYAQSEGEGKGSTFTFTLPKLKEKEAI